MRTIINPLIFIVEDEPIYLNALEARLRLKNYTNIQTFISGEECVENLHQKPDIVLLDYRLEGENGLEILKAIKIICPSTIVIFVSSLNSKMEIERCFRNGAKYFIQKGRDTFKILTHVIIREEFLNDFSVN